jgi:DNA-binding YbaB/EbfC family protein
MKQAQAMQKRMAELQEKMAATEFTGASGGGMVNVTINGKGEFTKLKIDPSMVNKDEVDILEDLIIAAFNDAKKKADSSSEGEMSGVLNGMGLPAGFKMPF